MSRDYYQQMWHKIKVEKEPYIGAVKNVDKRGREHWQEIIISPVLSEAGKVKFFISIEPDISERVEKETFQQEFVKVLAHQLQDPMASIRWSLQLLLERGGLSKEQKKIIEETYKSDKLLVDMVADLLVFARIGQTKLATKEIDLKAELESQISSAKTRYPDRQWNQSLEQANIKVGSAALVRQVFANLIDNAAKFAAKDDGQVGVELISSGTEAVVKVTNNGLTIPQEESGQIFTKLYQGTTSQATQLPGAGLGLFIAKQICDAFGWNISFASPNADGLTEFQVRIPIKKPSPVGEGGRH